jgi:hypothetical protein
MRIQALALLFLALVATIAADTTIKTEDVNGLRITRSLATYTQQGTDYRTSPDSGVVSSQTGSLVTISIYNMRKTSLENFNFTEDLTWIPTTKTITFSVKPDYNDGRGATWTVGSLASSQTTEVSYRVNSALNPESMHNAPLPKVEFATIKAILTVTRNANQGETVSVFLASEDGTPVANAKITANTPAGENLGLVTDSQGRSSYIPVDSGFYTYDVKGYDVAFLPSTQIEQVLISSPPQAAAVTPANGNGVISALGGIMPVLAVVLLVGLVAFALYAYLNTSPREDSGTYVAPQSRTDEGAPASSEQDSAMKYSISYGGSARQETASDDVKEQTKALLERRRRDEEAQQQAAPAETEGEKAPVSAEAAVTEASAQAAREVFEAKKEENEESLPKWMKGGEESYEGESAVVDDQTIQKTIEELEQLRMQLKERQEARSAIMHEGKEEEEIAEEEISPPDQEPKAPTPERKERVFPRRALKKAAPAKKKGRR